MKKKLITVIALFIAMALNAQVEGSWLLIKVTKDGKSVAEPGFITDFTKDGKMIMMGMEAGTFSYNASKKVLVMKSERNRKFNGNMEIKKLNGKEMSGIMSGYMFHYERIDRQKTARDNAKSGLEGVYKVSDEGGNDIYIKFDLPDGLVIDTEGDGFSEVSKGEWFYNSKKNSFYVAGLRSFLKGSNIISKKAEGELIFENKGNTIKAIKINTEGSKVEHLIFDMSENQEEEPQEEKLPWNDNLRQQLVLDSIDHIVYEWNTFLYPVDVFAQKDLLMKTEVDNEKNNVTFYFMEIKNGDTLEIKEEQKSSNLYNPFFPMEELDYYRVGKKEEIKVPAGTILCTVVEGLFNDYKIKYWMIDAMPGIYAKIIREKTPTEEGSPAEYEFFVLKKISKKE